MSDAILRTLFRLLVSRRDLLEWVTAAQAKVSPRLELAGFYRQMAGGVAFTGDGRAFRSVGRAAFLAGRSAASMSVAVVARRRAMGQPARGGIGAPETVELGPPELCA